MRETLNIAEIKGLRSRDHCYGVHGCDICEGVNRADATAALSKRRDSILTRRASHCGRLSEIAPPAAPRSCSGSSFSLLVGISGRQPMSLSHRSTVQLRYRILPPPDVRAAAKLCVD